MNRLLRNILIVLGLTIVLTSTALGLILAKEEASPAKAVNKSTMVLVAARQISAGHRIEQADLRWKDIGTGAAPAGAFTRPAHSELNAIGSVALRNLAPGELISQQGVVAAPAGDSLAGSLNPGWRAVTFAADASQTAAGMLQPNDKVDLILGTVTNQSPAASPGGLLGQVALASSRAGGPATENMTGTIENVRVIAINGAMRPGDGAKPAEAKPNGTITLEVRPTQVAAILAAASTGRLGVALRSRFDGTTPAAPPDRTVGPRAPKPKDGIRTVQQPRATKPDASRAATPAVIIIRGLEKPLGN